jgi:3-hydroxyacyl-[acyl-carrier-protein] dehydratase
LTDETRLFPGLVMSCTDGTWRGEAGVAPEHRCFAGHFEGHPILPAIAQLSLVSEALALAINGPVSIRSIDVLRLKAPVRPGEHLEIRLASIEGPVRFELRRGDDVVSQGTLRVDDRG